MQVLRYAAATLLLTGVLAAQTIEVSVTLKPEWHASFEKGMANLNQRRVRAGKPAQTINEFLTESLQLIVFSIADTQNEPIDKPLDIQQADQAIAQAQRTRQALVKSMSPPIEPPQVEPSDPRPPK